MIGSAGFMAAPKNEDIAKVDFRFIEFNDRRRARKADAARVAAVENGEEVWLWMNKSDIANNIRWHGEHPELLKAKQAYAA